MAEAEQYARTLSKRHPIPPDLARGRQDGSSRLLEKHFRTRMRCRDLDFVDVFGDWARLEGQKRQFQFRRSGMGQVFQQPARTGKITLLRTAERPAQQVSSTSPEAMPPALGGTWQSNLQTVYEVSQDGNRFTWTVAAAGQVAVGLASRTGVAASWQDQNGTLTQATGRITQINSADRATRIEWDNGVMFFRQ